MVFVLTIATNTYLNYRNSQEAVVEEAVVVTNNSNELVALLPDLIEISTNTFYSKYDVSNASANLQQIESSLLQYQNNLESRSDISNINTVKENLNNIFTLVNELDLVLSYRISISEVLIYDDLPTDEDSVNIEEITSNLSNIIAQSKVNIATLPDINDKKLKTLVDNIHNEIKTQGNKIKSEIVGETVLKYLKETNEVAYLRFASVYKEFSDASDFEKEVAEL